MHDIVWVLYSVPQAGEKGIRPNLSRSLSNAFFLTLLLLELEIGGQRDTLKPVRGNSGSRVGTTSDQRVSVRQCVRTRVSLNQ